MGEGEVGKKVKTTPDTGGKSDRTDDIQEARDENGGDDVEGSSAKRPSPCQTVTRLEVSTRPQPEDQDSQSHP